MQTIDEALEKLNRSKFRSGFHLNEKTKNISKIRERKRSDPTQKSLSVNALRRRGFRTTASRRRCEDIPYSKHSTPVLVAAAVA